MALDSTWVVLVAGCGVMGLAFWGGMSAMTLKTILLWLFIGFGFLTFLMHLFGSPISILLGKIFKTGDHDGNCNQLQGDELTYRFIIIIDHTCCKMKAQNVGVEAPIAPPGLKCSIYRLVIVLN